jgi:lipoprotein-anchoring transpeptidase ErfK/SrfK
MKRITRLAAALGVATLAGLLGTGLGASHRQAEVGAGAAALPATPAPALRIGKAQPLSSQRFVTHWTVVRRATLAHTAPTLRAAVVAGVEAYAPEGTPNLVPVLGTSARSDGLWVKVRLPALPNGSTGWVDRRSLGPYESVNTHLVVDRARLRATLYRGGKLVFTAPVGIGTDASPTPAGEFNVRSTLTRYASPFYGPIAFGTTARSAALTDWPDGGFVGIHGTNEPRLLPGRVSHGCIRLRNGDILRLAKLMPVGTPITIR